MTQIVVAEQAKYGTATGIVPRFAEHLGYLKEEGIEIKDWVAVTTGSDALNGMMAGDVHIAHMGAEGIAARSKGMDVVGIGAAFDYSHWVLLAQEGVNSWADMKGKQLALSSLTDIMRVASEKFIDSAGLNSDQDVEFVALGGHSQRVLAVAHGQVSGTMAVFPQVQTALDEGGLNNLGFSPDGQPIPLMVTDIEASRSWAEANPEVVSGYLRAMTRAVKYVKDPANEKAVIDQMTKWTKDPASSFKKTLETYFYNQPIENAWWPDDLRHAPGVFDATVDAYMDLGLIKERITEDEYMDYSYLDRALGK